MRIRIRDIEESVREFCFEEPTSELNPLLDQPVADYQLCEAARARVSCYRAGQDLFFAGEVSTRVVGRCARCAEGFEFTLETPLEFVLVPRSGRWTEEELEEQDVDTYDGDEVDLSPMVRERVLLSLPTMPLCRDACRGLCAGCGTNLNVGSCGCATKEGDLRLVVLRGLRSNH